MNKLILRSALLILVIAITAMASSSAFGFAVPGFTITSSKSGPGTITPLGVTPVQPGGSQSYSIIPDENASIEDVLVDGESQGPVDSYDFMAVSASHTISVTFLVNTFTVTATAGTHGIISPSGAVSVDQGSSPTFSFIPDAGFKVQGFTVDGTPQGVASSYTFTNVQNNHTVNVTFNTDTLSIVASKIGNGTITPLGTTLKQYNASQSYSIAATSGNHIVDVLVDGVSKGAVTSWNFTAIHTNHTIQATFGVDSVTVTETHNAGGTVTPAGTTGAPKGTNLTYTFTPDGSHSIDEVVVDGQSQGPVESYTFTNLTTSHTVAVTFILNSFSITATAGAHGIISPNGAVPVNAGASQAFTITPNTSYHIVNVLVDGSSVGPVSSYTFNEVSQNHTISASFGIDSFTISSAVAGNGSISPNGSTIVTSGGSQLYTYTPDPGWHLQNVAINEVSVGTPANYTFTNVKANKSILVTFAIDTFTITATSGPHGSIDPSGLVRVTYGSNQTFNDIPNTGYHLDSLIVDGSVLMPGGQKAPSSLKQVQEVGLYTFSQISANHSIRVTFAIDSFTIFGATPDHGTLTPAGDNRVAYGDSLVFTITPASGYHIADVLVNEGSVGAVSHYTFQNISADANIAAIFTIDTLSISATAGANGSVSPSGVTPVTYGGGVEYSITPATHYHIAGVLVDGSSVGAVSSYAFSNVTTSHTISASFAIDSFSITASAGANGSVTPSGVTLVPYNGTRSYTITPASHYRIVDVLVDGGSVGAVSSYNFVSVSATHTISASFALDSVTITASAGANGTISPNGSIRVIYGGSQSFTMTPATHYHVTKLLVDGSNVGALTSYTFNNDTAAHTIAATFGIDTFTIASSAGANGTIVPNGTNFVPYNGSKSFTITPASHYHVANVIVDGSSVGHPSSYTFVSVSANHTISASFAIDTFTITASSGANGTVTPAGATVFNYGSNQTYSITPDAHYHVANVLVDGSSVGAVTSYAFSTIAANHTISASFAIDSFSITASAGANGTISSTGVTTLPYGSNKTYTLTPSTHYHVTNVLVDGSSVGAVTSYTFSALAANHTISASFGLDTFTIAASAGANGSIAPVGSLLVPYNGSKTFTITPAAHYHIASVLVDGSSVGRPTSYTFVSVSANHTISASFAIDTFTITASSGANGTVTPAGATTVNYGAGQTYTISPAAHYHVLDVLVDGSSVGAQTSYAFSNVTVNHTISASFGIDTFAIAASAGSNGSISPSGTVNAAYNSSKTFTLTPSAHYHVADLLVDGASVGHPTSYTFASISANHTISASFAIDTFTITASAGSNGSVTPGGATVLNYGANQTYTITPVSHYHVANVLVDGSSVGAVTSYQFTGVSANHTISASFAIDTFTITASSGGNGTVTPAGATVLNYGGNQTYTITPATHYHVVNVLVDGSSVGAVTSYTFSAVSASHTISASFGVDTFTIASSAGSNGSISPSGSVKVAFNGTKTFTITPAAHYHVASVLVDGSSVGRPTSYTFASVSANHTISASFAIDTFTITATAGSNGSITPGGATTVNYGSNQSFTITPVSHYHVTGVLVDGSSVGAVSSYTFSNVTTNHTISASFGIDTFTVSESHNAGGSVSPAGSASAPYGGNLGFEFTPDGIHHVSDVTVDGTSQGAISSYSFTSLAANHTIVVTFAINTFTISASAGAHGSISPSGSVSVNATQSSSFTITAATGYHIDNVIVDDTSKGAISAYTFNNVLSNHTISASFAIDMFSIVATTSGTGSGSISPEGTSSVAYGDSITYTMMPNTGSHIVTVRVDGSSVGAVSTYKFSSVTAGHTIDAEFGVDTLSITSSTGPHGTIDPLGLTYVVYGQNQTFTYTPETGYHLDSLIVDGQEVGKEPPAIHRPASANQNINSYTFYEVTSNHTIRTVFAIDSFQITSVAGSGGTISPLGNTMVAYGGSQTYAITPDSGYHIADVRVGETSLGAISSYTFTNVTGNGYIEAQFAIDTFTVTASSGPNGSISPSGTVLVTYNGTQTFNFEGNSGYHVADVVVDGSSKGVLSSYTFESVKANHAISVSFALDTLTIAVTSNSGGTVTPSGNIRVGSGSSQNFTFAPATHYRLDSVIVDGASVAKANSYQFENVTTDHSLRVVFAPIMDTILATATSNGTLSPIGNVLVMEGSNQTFSITPDANANTVDVIVDGTSLGVRTTYTFSNVTTRHTIDVVFAVKTYTITATANTGGSIVPNGAVTVSHGANRSFTIAPETGYHLVDVFVDTVSVGAVGSYTFSNVVANHTIRAQFGIDSFTIVASAGTHGSISPSGSVVATYGSSKAFTFQPDTGYHVACVKIDGDSIGAPANYTFTNITGGHTISVRFAIDMHTITATAGTGGSFTPASPIMVPYGSDQLVNIVPSEGYHTTGVTVDGTPVGVVATYTFHGVITDHTISATFSNTYTITASAGSHGSISPSGEVSAVQGADKTFSITPQSGFHLSQLLVDGEPAALGSSFTFSNVQSNHTISASFGVDSFTIYTVTGLHGHISPADSVKVPFGSDQTMTIVPDTGYRTVEVFVDGIPRGPISSFTFTSVIVNHTIQAVFTIQQFTITSATVDSGSIAPLGTQSFDFGQEQTYTITPKEGYHIVDVRVDNNSLGVISSYTFSAIKASHIITAYFSNQYRIIASTDTNGTISPVDTVVVIQGTSQTFAIAPKTGRHLMDVLVDNVSVGKVSSFTFDTVMADHKIQAKFAIDTFTIAATAGTHGAINPSGTVIALYNTNKTFTFTPETGYKLSALHVDTVAVSPLPANFTFSNVTSNHTIAADFAINTYTIVASAGPHGSISPTGTTTINHGGAQTYLFAAAVGYHLDSLIVDNTARVLADSFRFSPVTASHIIRVVFAINTYVLNTDTVAGHGTVARTPDQGTYNHGTNVTVMATADIGWQFAGWSGDTTSTDSSLTVAMTHDRVLKATFTVQDRYMVQYRTGSYVDWATATDPSGKLKSLKRKANKIDFMFALNAPIQSDGRSLTLNFNGLSSGYIYDKKSNRLIDSFTNTKSKAFTFDPPRSVDSAIEVVGRYSKGKGLKITYAWGANKKNTVTVYDLFKPGLPMPNLHNLGEELFPGSPVVEASVAFPNGLLIGVPTGPNNSNSVLIKKYADVKKSMNANGSLHNSGTSCLVIKKQAKTFPPSKVQNHLFGEALTLKLNIGSSEVGKLPPGFGVLTYFDKTDTNNPYNGLPVARISLMADSVLSCIPGAFGGDRPGKIDSVLHDLNAAFAGVAVDTSSFSTSTVLKGARALIEVGYLRITPNSMPIPISTPGPAIAALPDEFTLFQNYPNPFNPTTTIEFNLPYVSRVTLKVYNLLGQEVATLLDHEQMDDGLESVDFDASKLASGVYFYRMNAQGMDDDGLNHEYSMIKKMVLVK